MANFYFFIRIFGVYVNNYFVSVPSFVSGIFLIERRRKKRAFETRHTNKKPAELQPNTIENTGYPSFTDSDREVIFQQSSSSKIPQNLRLKSARSLKNCRIR
jgi:hypothetical protein